MSPFRKNLLTNEALNDDDIFSQLINSSSSSYLPSASVDYNDSLTGSIAQKSINRDSSSSDTTHNIRNEVLYNQVGPRLRLQVRPPRSKITLRVIKLSAKDRDKRRRSQVTNFKERSRSINIDSD